MSTSARGFTLIETLVAVVLFSATIAGLLSLARLTINSGSVTKEDITASYLAQDGLEFLVSIRDSDLMGEDNHFFEFFTSGNPCTANDCVIETTASGDAVADVIEECSSTCIPLKYNTATGKYTYLSGTPSIYRRTLRVEHLALSEGGTELKMTVTVTWQNSAGVTNEYSLSRNFLPIKEVSIGT